LQDLRAATPGWHAACQAVVVGSLSGSRVRRPPTELCRALSQRGVDLELRFEEDAESYAMRIETALMALFRDGPGESEFAALYEYARGDLYAYIESLSRDGGRRWDPDEILQDTFVSIYRYASGFRDEYGRSFRIWSRTIARNLDRRRRATRSLQALPEGHAEPADARHGPEHLLLVAEERRSLAGAWLIVLGQYANAYQSLSTRDRLALDLIEVQGLTYAQACRRLNVGMSNMKMIMFRARKRIRAIIGSALAAGQSSVRKLAS
jgi:RNA polymerase sigma-70 factor (ECF subfamily)